MGIKTFTTKLSKLNNSGYLRLDTKFNFFVSVKKFSAWQIPNSILLKNVMKDLLSPTARKGELDEEYYLVDLSNVERKTNSLKNLVPVTEIGSDKNIISKGDIAIPKLEPRKGQFFLNLEHKEYLTTTELIEYSIDTALFNPTFLYYTLVTDNFLEALACLESGKTHRRVNPDELLRIKIPSLPIKIQDAVVAKIVKLEAEIKNLKSQIKPDTEVINKVFTAKFGWDTKTFDELSKVHIMNCTLSALTNNIDNRFSFKFHNKAGAYVSQILKLQSSKRIKDFLAEEITLGKSISPADYDENEEQYYVSMADIKNWRFEIEEAKTVLRSYFDANPNKRIALNDIIMARSGEGTIGKVAIIDNEENEGVYADFTMRIRLKNYNPIFAYYYFRTDFFQCLVYTNKKGLGNNTNIFPSQVRELPLPELSLEDQEKVLLEIQTDINKQRVIEISIQSKQHEISKLIEAEVAKINKQILTN